MNDEIIWGYCAGSDLGYNFSDIEDDADCLTMVQSSGQIDYNFRNREKLDTSGWHPKPFGCWRIKY